MEAFMPLLATCGRPIHSHDAWHLALLYLEELDVAATMRVFRDHIWGITPDFVVEQLDAISLLWRIEMAGTAMDAEGLPSLIVLRHALRKRSCHS
jgi:hypothetical protein